MSVVVEVDGVEVGTIADGDMDVTGLWALARGRSPEGVPEVVVLVAAAGAVGVSVTVDTTDEEADVVSVVVEGATVATAIILSDTV